MVRLFMNVFYFVRWVSFSGWRRSFTITRFLGPQIQKETGLSILRQLVGVLYLVLYYSVPPINYYYFKFYLPGRRKQILSYVYNLELPAFHVWCNQGRYVTDEVDLVSNKYLFAQKAFGAGLPVVETLLYIHRGRQINHQVLLNLSSQPLFCKPNRGSSGNGAFCINTDGKLGTFKVSTLAGESFGGDAAEVFLTRQFSREDYLVEPFLNNHPEMAHLTNVLDTIVLRVITVQTNNDRSVYCCYLEIPYQHENTPFLGVCPVDEGTGFLQPLVLPLVGKESAVLLNLDSLTTWALPYWQESIQIALSAHKLVANLASVAWDIVISESGPVLLEGNTNWDVVTPQIIKGGILNEAWIPSQL
ncbi:sugar-transfer associated ATP-grasp domain-containing protein [Oleiphilus messinensis]|nr:sugar-transfer associated ATP-grasp domain-containing protein [Oleiphilus messinensis]